MIFKDMDKITTQEFQIAQPSFPKEMPSDIFYFNLANHILDKLLESKLLSQWNETLIKRTVIGITGYYQDIISDAGIWRSFINANRRLYGRELPFFETGEEYIDYELNEEDVRFLIWYSLALYDDRKRFTDPLSEDIAKASRFVYGILEENYDEAPVPEGFNISHGLRFHDKEDSEAIYHLGNWLFMHCYLMKPAFAMTLGEVLSDPELHKPENMPMLQQRLEQSMMEDPTGPLAYFIPEWVYLIIEGKMPEDNIRRAAPVEGEGMHPYYQKFIKATGGKTIKYFDNYKEMNGFFIEALGWEAGEEHLAQMKHEKNFILMVNPKKGMLLAKNIAENIADPDNPYYNKAYAHRHAFEMLSVRGCCPGDLLKYVCGNGWLPDAVFPGTENHKLVADNWDFIARCYLQQYYRGD